MGSTFIVIGAPGTGKSPFVKALIENRRCLIFDVANEYGARVKYPGQIPLNLSTDIRQPRSRFVVMDLKGFLNACNTKRDTVCVFEEATGFMQGMLQLEVTQLMIGRLHTGNTYVFVFHSINSVPPRILEMSSYAVLFKTNDIDRVVDRKAPRLYDYYKALQEKPAGEKFVIKIMET
jgi:hypothetical protein